MTEGSRVLVALRVPATPERAFAAFTGEIGRWWQPNGLFVFDRARRDGTLVFEPGPAGRLLETYLDGSSTLVGDVRAWEPPHRLVVGWRQAGFAPDQDTELHVRFDAVDTPADAPETRVVVEHFGWDRIPQDNLARHGFPLPTIQVRFAEWWRSQLASLAHVASG